MLNFVIGLFLLSQLQLSGAIDLPQIIEPEFTGTTVSAGSPSVIEVALEVRDGFLINRIPQMQLNLETVDGMTLAETRFVSSSEDPKSTDTYYVDVPGFAIGVEALRPGQFKIPGELVYFFCNKADGYCSRQIVEVEIPVRAR